jgi:hypothetical protein
MPIGFSANDFGKSRCNAKWIECPRPHPIQDLNPIILNKQNEYPSLDVSIKKRIARADAQKSSSKYFFRLCMVVKSSDF